MKTKALPKSKARTAYGLLSEICTLITAEPKRYAQRFFIARKAAQHTNRALYLASDDIVWDYPACGTVGCIAGWVATLKGPKRFAYGKTYDIAASILGLSRFHDDGESSYEHTQADELFGGAMVPFSNQTPEHAAAGVAHIKKFQAKYASQLRAKRV